MQQSDIGPLLGVDGRSQHRVVAVGRLGDLLDLDARMSLFKRIPHIVEIGLQKRLGRFEVPDSQGFVGRLDTDGQRRNPAAAMVARKALCALIASSL